MRLQAIRKLYPNAVTINGESDVRDGDDKAIEIDEDSIQEEEEKLMAAWDAQEYARNRASAYPNIGDQMDMIYKDNKNSTTTHADAVEAVKTKWPKDNSGPVE